MPLPIPHATPPSALSLWLVTSALFACGTNDDATPEDSQDATELDVVPNDSACHGQTASYRLEGQVIRPSGLEGTLHLLFYESESVRCTDDPDIVRATTPGDLVGELAIESGQAFSLDVNVAYVGREPSIEVIAYLDVEGDGQCDPDTDSGEGITLEPGDQSAIEIVLERGRCVGLVLVWPAAGMPRAS